MINKLLKNAIKKLFSIDINAIHDENQKLKDQIKSLQEESNSLKNKFNDSNKKISYIENENTVLKTGISYKDEEISALRETLTRAENSKDALKEELDLLNSQLKQKEEYLTTLRQTNGALEKENEMVKRKFTELETENMGLTEQISPLKAMADELKIEAKKYREKFELEKSERQNEHKELLNIQTKSVTEIEELNDRIKKLSDAKSEEMHILENKIQNLEETVRNINRDKELLQDQMRGKESELKAITDTLKEERNKVVNLKSDNKTLKEQIERLKEEITKKEKEVPYSIAENGQVANNPVSDIEDTDKQHEEEPEEPKNKANQKSSNKRGPMRNSKTKEEVVIDKVGNCIEDFPEIKNEVRSVKRSIEFVFDTKEKKINADDFFTFSTAEEIAQVSRNLAEADKTGTESWTCGMCRSKVKVAHRTYNGAESLFFIHADRDHYCPWIKLSDKSNDTINVAENDPTEDDDSIEENYKDTIYSSRKLKEKIFSALTSSQSSEQGISNVRMDKIVRSSLPYMRWRKPDLSFEYNGRLVVIELQSRKTPLDTIVDKDIFYRLNNIHVLWVFGIDSDTSYQYLTKSNYKNTMFANHRNVFVFDKEAQDKSEHNKVLSFKCNWLDVNNKWAIRTETEQKNGRIITLPELIFDDEFCKPYFFDANEPYFNLHPLVKSKYYKNIDSREELLKKLEEKWTRDVKYEEAIRQMKENGQNATVWKCEELWGFRFNSTSLIQPIFTEEPKIISNGYYKVKLVDGWGIINRYGQKIVDWDGTFICEDIDFDYDNHRVFLKNNGEWGVADTKGNILVPCQFSSIENWTSEAYRVKQNEKWGIVNLEGQIIVPCKYNRIDQLIGNKAKAELLASNNWQILHGSIDSLGKPIPNEYKNMPGGFRAVNEFERWGLLGSDSYLLEPEYEDISYWGQHSLYRVKKGGKWGVVNATNKETIISIQYEEISDLENGVSRLRRVGLITNVDANGNEVSQEEVILQDGQRKIKKSGKWGIIDKDNNEIIPCLYDEIGSFRSRMIGIINGRIVKLNAWYNYPILLQATYEHKTTKGIIFDIAGVKCFLPLQLLKLKNKTLHDIIDKNGRSSVLAFSNIIIPNNIFTDYKVMMRICEGENLKKPLSHGDKDTDFQMNEVLTGVVYEVRRFKSQTKKVMVKFEDCRKTMVPARFFKKFDKDINDYPKESTITLKKVGFNDDLDQTKWEIVR